VHRAAVVFLKKAGSGGGVKIHLEKNLPLAAGIGAGSANAAVTLHGLNELWGKSLADDELHKLAVYLGSDVPFFLTDSPALARGRGEQVELMPAFSALQDIAILLINPGFGVSTPWAYRELGNYPEALDGSPGRASALADELNNGTLSAAADLFYNSLEQPVFEKHPVLPLIRDYLQDNGAIVSRMSGSGATLFALSSSRAEAEKLRAKYHGQFGQAGWSRTVLL
jgi:4-diphosphocytidyl-2-C-methyl-D-erythritol kinase